MQQVDEYIASLPEPRRSQVAQLDGFIRSVVPELEVKMWGKMIGYGSYHYKYKSGTEGDWFVVGLAGRKQYVSLYILGTKDGEYLAESAKEKLPGADIGKSCIRFKHMENVDMAVLHDLIIESRDQLQNGAL